MFPEHRCWEIIFLTSQALTLISTAAFASVSSPGPTTNSRLQPFDVKAKSCLRYGPCAQKTLPEEPDKLSHFVNGEDK